MFCLILAFLMFILMLCNLVKMLKYKHDFKKLYEQAKEKQLEAIDKCLPPKRISKKKETFFKKISS